MLKCHYCDGGIKLNTKTFFITLFTVIIWSSSFPGIRAALHGGYSPGHFVLGRYLIASGAYLLIALWPGVKIRLPRKKDILQIILLGLSGISMYHLGITFGEQTISAGATGMLVASAPIFTALIAVFILKERLSLIGWVGLGLGFLGIAITTFGTSGATFKLSSGALLVIMSAVATAVLFAFQKPLLERYSSIELTAYFTWVGTIPFLIFLPDFFHDVQLATLEANLSVIYIGIFPTVIGYITWSIALSLSKASSVTSMLYIEPLFVILIAWIWLNEWPSIVAIVGGMITIIGVIVVNVLGKNSHKAATIVSNTIKN